MNRWIRYFLLYEAVCVVLFFCIYFAARYGGHVTAFRIALYPTLWFQFVVFFVLSVNYIYAKKKG